MNNPLSVGVTVDLFRYAGAGGHVKCWERLAEAAAQGQEVDLTVYWLGEREEITPLVANVRYHTLRPALGTNRFRFLDQVVDHTDVAPRHRRLRALLKQHDVLHTTGAYFALSRTAAALARSSGQPLVSSLHSDVPGYTRIQSALVFRRVFGDGYMNRLLCQSWKLPERLGRRMEERLARHLRYCSFVLTAGDGSPAVNGLVPGKRLRVLRRGIDKQRFHPGRRDRKRLREQLGIREDCFVLLTVGRLDPGKSVMTAAEAARELLDRGRKAEAIFVGAGREGASIRELLGKHAHLTGTLPQEELPWLYASADLFVFPSQVEIAPNVVVEAKASGLPVMVAPGGSAQFVAERADGIIVEDAASAAWAKEIEALIDDSQRLRALGERARQWVEERWPSWRDVLLEDLLPVWQQAAAESGKR